MSYKQLNIESLSGAGFTSKEKLKFIILTIFVLVILLIVILTSFSNTAENLLSLENSIKIKNIFAENLVLLRK